MSITDMEATKRLREIYEYERRKRKIVREKKPRPRTICLSWLAQAVSRPLRAAWFRASEWLAHYTGW